MQLLEGCDSRGSLPYPTPCTWVTAKIIPALSITVPAGQEAKEMFPALARREANPVQWIQSNGLTKSTDGSRLHFQHVPLGFGSAKDSFAF